MGVCGCVIPSPDCHCHFTPVSDWQYNNLTNHLITMPKSVLDQIGKEHTEEIERLRQQLTDLLVEMERIADVSERWEDCLVSQINEIARKALAKSKEGLQRQ